MKKITAFITLLCIILQSIPVFALTDEFIFTDPVRDTFSGRIEANALIENLKFMDMNGHWANESTTRAGSLNIVKGYDSYFYPDRAVTNGEMLSAVLRSIGMEQQAMEYATLLGGNQVVPLSQSHMTGYLYLAYELGFITYAQYNDTLAGDQESLAEETNFVYNRPVTRQQAAYWIYYGFRLIDENAFNLNATNQKTYNFSDWNNVLPQNAAAVEALVLVDALSGDSSGRLRPNESLTNGELTQIYKNLDNAYYSISDIEKRNGTVGGLMDGVQISTGSASTGRRVFVRSASGQIDVIQNFAQTQNSGTPVFYDAPVNREGTVGSMSLLQEGDEIEYLIRTETEEVLYIQVAGTKPVVTSYFTGQLLSISHFEGTITLRDESDAVVTHVMANAIYYTENNVDYIYLNENIKQTVSDLSVGSTLQLRLKNNIVDAITFIGEESLEEEFRGIVIENNTDFGYLVVIDNSGKQIVKNFYDNDIKVKKQQYYDADDEIGYIAQMFPYFKYNPTDSSIHEIEPGDIVFIRTDPDNPDYISAISASTNYIAKYGKILQYTYNGSYYEMLVEYENKQTSWFDVSPDVFISRSGKPVSSETVQVGDWAKILVNQAVIAPGYVLESAKEFILEGEGHHISTLLKAQLAGFNQVQNKLDVQNVQTLTTTGWSNYKQADSFDLSGNDVEFYADSRRISLEEAMRFYKRADNQVYIALENNYAGEKIRKVTIRSGRDELLSSDTVINTNGGSFTTLSGGSISTDDGTIVRRNGRLVNGTNIMIPDYAHVSLNGGRSAAVVDIYDKPDNSQAVIARGRILSVDEGNSFKVQSMSILTGNSWSYTPVSREFSIDYNTLFINESGVVSQDTFKGYTEDSVINKVYYVVIDGSRASHIIEAPYSTKAVKGTVYSVTDTTVSLKDAYYYNNTTGAWLPVSNTNATVTINVHPNSLIAKNNQVVTSGRLTAGDNIRVMTNNLPDKVTPGTEVDGYLILVE